MLKHLVESQPKMGSTAKRLSRECGNVVGWRCLPEPGMCLDVDGDAPRGGDRPRDAPGILDVGRIGRKDMDSG